MARLPETYEENTIHGMSPGDEGYTVPWAMWADRDRELLINGYYTVYPREQGTAHLRIRRTREGVIVYQHTIGDHKYHPGPRGFMDDGALDLPVELRK